MTDRALHEALRQQEEQTSLRLPSNFAYTTMRRIEKEQRAREWKERVIAAITIGACCLLGVGAMLYYYSEALLQGFKTMIQHHEGISLLPGLVFCFLFLATLNLFLHRHFAHK